MSRRASLGGAAPVLACMVAALAGCGSGKPQISAGASAALTREVAAVRAAAGTHDGSAALARLAELRAMLATLQQSGQISAGRAAQIAAAAAAVEAQLGAITTTTTTVVTRTTPAPGPTPAPTRAPAVRSKGKGGDKGGD